MNVEDQQQSSEINEIPATTPDFKTDLAKKLQEIAPEAIADGKVDPKKLQELLGDDARDTSERFGLFWPGKKQAMHAAQEPTSATLKPVKEDSKDWDSTQNLFIEGDNLEVLKILQKHYHGKVKMIYIDPPYNTGKDFVYPDNYKEGLQSYLEFTKQVDEEGRKVRTNVDTVGRYHSNWLNMMYPRLKLARNLLADDGVIFISIDDNEQDNLKKICNEVFGEDNFIENLIWQKKYRPQNDAKNFSTAHDYILCYARNSVEVDAERGWKRNLLERSDEGKSAYKNPDNDPRGPWQSSGLMIEGVTKNGVYEIIGPTGKVFSPSPGKRWSLAKASFDNAMQEGRIWFGKDGTASPRIKRYLSEVQQGIVPASLLFFETVGHTGSGAAELKKLDLKDIFSYPKPASLIGHLVKIGTKHNDIILDFFSGSGTTAHAVMQLNAEDGGNRKHIQVQLPEPTEESSEAYEAGYKTIADIAKERIRRAGEKIKEKYADKLKDREEPLDVGFKVYKLSDTNFAKWQSEYTDDTDEIQARLLDVTDNTSDDSSEEDMLSEILLKLGFGLTIDTDSIDINGLKVWNVASGSLLAYLGETEPTLDQLRALAGKEPAKIVLLDKSFNGNDELKVNLRQICETNNIELWTV